MLSILARGHPPQRTRTALQSKVYYEDGRASQEFYSAAVNPKYVITHTVPAAGVPTMFNPPLHFHSFQMERFQIHKGVGHFFSSSRSKVPDPSKPIVLGAGDTMEVPVGAYHRFESADPESPLVVDFGLEPDTRDEEIRFFRNFMGYLDDCRKAGMQPSLFQMLRFLSDVSAPLAIPIPIPFIPASVGRALSWAFTYTGGILVGKLLLGYKGTYDEYYLKEEEDLIGM